MRRSIGLQVNLDCVLAQRFEHRDDQQAGRMIAEAVGDEADAQRCIDRSSRMRKREVRAQRRGARFDGRRAGLRTLQLLGRARGLGEEAERCDAGRALASACAQARRQRIEIVPVAQLPAQEDELAERLIEM
jgi:hypothetical protein